MQVKLINVLTKEEDNHLFGKTFNLLSVITSSVRMKIYKFIEFSKIYVNFGY